MLKKVSVKYSNSLIGYLIAMAVGIFVGYRISPGFIAVPYILLSLACIFFAFQNDAQKVLCLLPYLIYTEMFIRAYVVAVPYLFLQYLLVCLFTILFLRNSSKVKVHSRCFVLFLLFFIIEGINYTRSLIPDVARGLMVNTFMLGIMILWSSFNFLTPVIVNNILKHIKYASIYLCGIVLARYIIGGVSFSGVSGSEGTNGLAPVQISGYLGFSCSVLFFSIMNGMEKKNMVLNLILFSITTIIMLLSFSRGGLYFLAIMIVLYFFFNRKELKSYFLFILLIPFAILIYYYVSEATNGLLINRYEQQGSSGRDELVKAGWDIFLDEPLVGVGLGNFGKEIVERKLYALESGAHDEFIRVAAEDGLLGVITYWGFFIWLFYEIWARQKIQREYGIYFLIFFCLICVHNGLKISLQPLLLILAIATPSVITVKKKKHVSIKPKLAA